MRLEKIYRGLPEHFHSRVKPTPVRNPRLVAWSASLCVDLGWDPEPEPNAASIFSGNQIPDGAEPIAMAYAGHQFGHFVPQLGDGRAILLGEVRDAGGRIRDVQLKGAGPTPYSRRGDGRSALGPALREFLVSESMAALGIPTTRSLAVVRTGETVFREEPVPGGIVTRVAASHVRVGTFQYFAAQGDFAAVETLAGFVLGRHYPELDTAENPFLGLLEAVVARQASLIAQWMQVGFIHGVMNTDNMAVGGETIDYGPCAFMDAYDPMQVYSAIDRGGRYAFCNQPAIAQWNLARFAETLLPLIDSDTHRAVERAGAVISSFPVQFETHRASALCAKIGLNKPGPEDVKLVDALLAAMSADRADYTLTFRRLCDVPEDPRADAGVRMLFANPTLVDAWLTRWRDRLRSEEISPREIASAMRRVNPALIPRNHRVEQALEAAVHREDFGPFEKLHRALLKPFERDAEKDENALPPLPHEEIANTFCGT